MHALLLLIIQKEATHMHVKNVKMILRESTIINFALFPALLLIGGKLSTNQEYWPAKVYQEALYVNILSKLRSMRVAFVLFRNGIMFQFRLN